MATETGAPRRGVWMFLPPALIGLGLLVFAASNPAEPADDATPPEPRTVRVVEARATPITPRAVGYGAAEPARVWAVVADVSGRIAQVSPNFSRGGFVEAGELIIRIDDSDYQLAADQARADILSIDAQIEELKLTEQNLQATLALERQSLAVAERELQRQRDLVARGAGTQAAVDSSERAALTLRSSVLELENQIRLVPAQIAALESSKAVAQARLEDALLDIERVEIVAPFDGRVAEASAEISQFVGAGSSLGSVDGVDRAEIVARFPAAEIRDFGRLATRGADPQAVEAQDRGLRRFDRIGENFGVRAVATMEVGSGDAFGAASPSWSAEVLRVSDSIDPETRAIGVIVAVDDPYGQAQAGQRPALIKGAFLRVELYAPAVDGLVLAPRAALRTGPTGAAEILVIGDDNLLERREVELVATMSEVAAIGGGLEEGDLIVVTDLAPAILGEEFRPVIDEAMAERLAKAAEPPAGAAPPDAAAGAGEADAAGAAHCSATSQGLRRPRTF